MTFFSAAASAHRDLLIRQHAPVCTAVCPLFVSESLQSVGQMHRAINVAAAAAQSAKSNASDKHREEHGTRDQKANLRSSCCVLARRRWIKCICQVCAKGSVCVGAVVAIGRIGVIYERRVMWACGIVDIEERRHKLKMRWAIIARSQGEERRPWLGGACVCGS